MRMRTSNEHAGKAKRLKVYNREHYDGSVSRSGIDILSYQQYDPYGYYYDPNLYQTQPMPSSYSTGQQVPQYGIPSDGKTRSRSRSHSVSAPRAVLGTFFETLSPAAPRPQRRPGDLPPNSYRGTGNSRGTSGSSGNQRLSREVGVDSHSHHRQQDREARIGSRGSTKDISPPRPVRRRSRDEDQRRDGGRGRSRSLLPGSRGVLPRGDADKPLRRYSPEPKQTRKSSYTEADESRSRREPSTREGKYEIPHSARKNHGVHGSSTRSREQSIHITISHSKAAEKTGDPLPRQRTKSPEVVSLPKTHAVMDWDDGKSGWKDAAGSRTPPPELQKSSEKHLERDEHSKLKSSASQKQKGRGIKHSEIPAGGSSYEFASGSTKKHSRGREAADVESYIETRKPTRSGTKQTSSGPSNAKRDVSPPVSKMSVRQGEHPRTSPMPQPKSANKPSDPVSELNSWEQDPSWRKGDIIEIVSVHDSDDDAGEPTTTTSHKHGQKEGPAAVSAGSPAAVPDKGKQAPANTKEAKRLMAKREDIIKNCKKEVKKMLPISEKYKWVTKTWEDKMRAFDNIDKEGDNFDAEVKAQRDNFLKSYKQRLLGERSTWKESTGRDGQKKFKEIEELLQGVRKKENEGLPK